MNIYQKARQLRLKPTGAEELLKHHLRGWGYHRIRRQVVIGKMIVDLAIPSINVLIEVDGGIHQDKAKDRRRDFWARGLGFMVFRFTNEEVMYNSDVIRLALQDLKQTKEATARFRIASALARKHETPLDEIRLDPIYTTKAKGETERVCCHRCKEWKTPGNFNARDGKHEHVCDSCVDASEPHKGVWKD